MLILTIDPGSKPGYCLAHTDPFKILCVSSAWPRPLDRHTVIVERPGLRPGAKINPNSVVTLAITAGVQAGEAATRAERLVWLTPKQWKNNLYRNGISVVKSVFLNRLRRDLSPFYEGLEYCTDDQVDAIGIAWAVSKGGLL